MNRDQKAVVIEEIATHIQESQAVFAVDYRGITVAQVAELRTKLREGDATFTVVKNSLTERAADQAGAEPLKEFLAGPTALTFVRGDIAVAAKAVADYARTTQLLPFKGGLMGSDSLDADQIRSLSKLPSREILYGQLVGMVASPVSGLVRSLGGLLGGLAVALGQVNAKKESGEIPSGEAPAAAEAAPVAAEEAPAAAEVAPAAEEAPAGDTPGAEEAPAEEAPAAEEPQAEAENQAEPEQDQPAPEDDNKADVSAESESAETNPTKED